MPVLLIRLISIGKLGVNYCLINPCMIEFNERWEITQDYFVD